MTAAIDRRNAATGAVDQVDQRNAVLVRQVFDEAALTTLLAIAAPAGAAAHGEIFAADGDWPPIDRRQAHDIRGRSDGQQCWAVVSTLPGELADFVERSGVGQADDPLADRQPPLLVMFRHRRGAAELVGLGTAKAQFDQWLGVAVPQRRLVCSGSVHGQV